MSASELARWAAALACGLTLASAFGQQQVTREQEQLRRLRLQVQQLQQEQSAQQDVLQRANADKAAATAQFEAAQAELRRTRSAAVSQTQNAGALQKELDAARDARSALQAQVDQLQATLKDSGRSVEQLRADGGMMQRRLVAGEAAYTDLMGRHAAQAQGLQACIANNQALRDIGSELLQRYADKGVAEVLAQNEPFLQIKRVALENLLQGYQDKLDQQALKPVVREPARAP